MQIEIKDVTDENFEDISVIPEFDCSSCIYWESPEDFSRKIESEKAKEKKRKWFASMARTLGSCGKVLYMDGKPVGFVEFGPPSALPSLEGYPTGPPNEEAFYITCIVVNPSVRRRGLATMLIQNVIEDLRRRNVKSLEVFACRGLESYPSGPMELYEKLGFEIIKDDEQFPLMRLRLQ